MTTARRVQFNYALDRALELCKLLGKPLLIVEELAADYPWANSRHHRFAIEGMADLEAKARSVGCRYIPQVAQTSQEPLRLFAHLARSAASVVTDDYPSRFAQQRLLDMQAALKQQGRRLEAVDSNGLYPMRATDVVFSRAHSFRRALARELAGHLETPPKKSPLTRYSYGRARLPPGTRELLTSPTLSSPGSILAKIPRLPKLVQGAERGGALAANRSLERFIKGGLAGYGKDRNHPDENSSSQLSAYLRFGHLSPHQVLAALQDAAATPCKDAGPPYSGLRGRFWGLEEGPESFLDQLVVWRELGYNYCALRPDYDHYSSLPAWALETLNKHRTDPREVCYSASQFAAAATHDPLWNAAQTQLVREGRMHNYLRMLWGKKILEWSSTPEDALATMLELNNRYALDGRDPNSVSGIMWIFGRYDRAWGPERPIYGKLRYMSSANTHKKLRLKSYLQHYAADRRGAQQIGV